MCIDIEPCASDHLYIRVLSTAFHKFVTFLNAKERCEPALREGFPPQATGEPEGR